MSGTISIKMRDLVPHKHAVRCTIGDRNHVQEIEVVSVRWLDDGSKLSAMLASHNFIVEEPDTVLGYIVEMNPQDWYYRKRVDEWVLPPRPTPAPTVESLLAENERLREALRDVAERQREACELYLRNRAAEVVDDGGEKALAIALHRAADRVEDTPLVTEGGAVNRYSPYYDPDEHRVRMGLDAEGSWVHIAYAQRLYDALALAEVEVALERSWCRVCRTEGRGEHRGRAEHPHEKGCPLYRGLDLRVKSWRSP